MKKYRIVRRALEFGPLYFVQRRVLFFWVDMKHRVSDDPESIIRDLPRPGIIDLKRLRGPGFKNLSVPWIQNIYPDRHFYERNLTFGNDVCRVTPNVDGGFFSIYVKTDSNAHLRRCEGTLLDAIKIAESLYMLTPKPFDVLFTAEGN